MKYVCSVSGLSVVVGFLSIAVTLPVNAKPQKAESSQDVPVSVTGFQNQGVLLDATLIRDLRPFDPSSSNAGETGPIRGFPEPKRGAPILSGPTSPLFDRNIITRNLNDFGGGQVTGLQIHALEVIHSGGGRPTGFVSNRIPTNALGDNIRLDTYGEINIGFVDVDNGNPAGDNSNFSTLPVSYAGFALSKEFGNSFAGVRLAGAYGNNRIDIKTDFDNDDAGCDTDDRDRMLCAYDANVFFGTPEYGKITIGLGETAFNEIGSINLGGIAYVTNNNPISKMGHHELFGLGLRAPDVVPDVTGVNRGTGIRYDTPTFAGFTLSASWGDANHVDAPADSRDYWDTALRYAGEFGALRVAGGIGYQEHEREGANNPEQSNFTASGSIMHLPTGVYINGSYSVLGRDSDTPVAANQTDDASSYYVQIGKRNRFTSIGDTVLYAEFGGSNDGGSSGDYFRADSESSNYGLGAVQELEQFGLSLFMTYNSYSTEVGNAKGEAFDTFIIGGRMNF